MSTALHPINWVHHITDRATHWMHAHHADTLRRHEGIGAYAAATLDHPRADEWPTTPVPRYIQARAQGMQVVAVKQWATAELAAVFNY